MAQNRPYFFCGIGGSGMLPLALIVQARGSAVEGSDRALDQGRTADKFEFLRARGIKLYAQDGSGVTRGEQIVVTSAAVEETVPDVQSARRVGATLMTRAELLAELFNAAPVGIAVGGTSGKSTTTGMLGWILHATGRDPTVMNGAVMKNFVTAATPFASALVGKGDIFVSEVDESDGSIARYHPKIAVLNNVSLDHRSLDELRSLFRTFIAKAQTAVLNRDNVETMSLANNLPASDIIDYSLIDSRARLFASKFDPAPDGVSFRLKERDSGGAMQVHLHVPGAHNVANALAAIGAAMAAGVDVQTAAKAIEGFTGIRRRLDVIGTAKGVMVIDDFAHNPDKITATLATLHAFPGRLLLMFQPHGYGPLRLMKDLFIDCFAGNMRGGDVLLMPDPVYFGGTTTRSVTSADIVEGVEARGHEAYAFHERAACGDKLVALARSGDRIVIMGARDDTLSTFAADVLRRIGSS